MKLRALGMDGAWLLESPVGSDVRRFFREWFKFENIKRVTGREFAIEKADIPLSSVGTLRIIH